MSEKGNLQEKRRKWKQESEAKQRKKMEENEEIAGKKEDIRGGQGSQKREPKKEWGKLEARAEERK